MTITLVHRWENVDNVQAGEVGAGPDVLHPGDRPQSLQERFCLGPQAQLISVHYLGVPPQFHPEGTHKLPRTLHMDPPTSRPSQQERTVWLRSFYRGSRLPSSRRQGITHGYWQTRGVSSTRESPCAEILRAPRDSLGASSVRLKLS